MGWRAGCLGPGIGRLVDDKGTREPLTPFSYAEARVGPDITKLRQVGGNLAQ